MSGRLAIPELFPYHEENVQGIIMFTPVDRIPLKEIRARHDRCREILSKHVPSAGGFLITGIPNIYYMTGTSANGLFWLPREGGPVLAVRKGIERAGLESPLSVIVPFKSYKELPALCEASGSPLARAIAVDQAGLSWEQGRLLQERLPDRELIPSDAVLARTRAVKSEYELVRMREACRRTQACFNELAERVRPGMSEYAIGALLWEILFAHGHAGYYPTGMHGSGGMLGHICIGDNGNYPCAYDGPLGVRGVHPAVPSLGSRDCVWQRGQVLTVDGGFNFEGYVSDKTLTLFAGKPEDIPPDVRKAHNTVMAILDKTVAALRPGAIPADIYALSLGMAKEAGYAKTFMGANGNQVRFLGHGIGMTISEWPIFARGFSDPLEQGMTVALEPKIALPGIAMVGIEHTYEITATGALSLTGDANDIVCVT